MLLLISSLALATTPDRDDSWLNGDRQQGPRVRLNAEVGALLPVSHKIQFDQDGTYFDYVKDGGQDNLFATTRWSADLDLGQRHSIVLLYQPLDLQTSVLLQEDLVVDDEVFAAGTPMALRYGFSYTRASYLYDLQPGADRELAVGASLQLRNAVIDFRSEDGTQQRSNRNIGPVPILKVRTRQPFGEQAWWGVEADGFYAPISYLNGDNNDVVGAILDANARVGLELDSGVDAYLSLRYIGGGAVGTDDDNTGPGDGYNRNWIHLTALTLGFQLR